MKLTYKDSKGTEFNAEGASGLIQVTLQQLKDYRDDGRVPSEDLLWEIRLYEHILAQSDPNKAADEYLEARHIGAAMRSKRAAVKYLGWVVE